MDRPALREWITKRPEIAEQLLRVVARRLRRTNNMLADLIFTDVPGRVAKALLQLAQHFGIQEARPAAGHPRPHAGGDRPARRRLPRDGEQGAGRLRRARLAAPGGQERAHPRPAAPGPPRPLTKVALQVPPTRGSTAPHGYQRLVRPRRRVRLRPERPAVARRPRLRSGHAPPPHRIPLRGARTRR